MPLNAASVYQAPTFSMEFATVSAQPNTMRVRANALIVLRTVLNVTMENAGIVRAPTSYSMDPV